MANIVSQLEGAVSPTGVRTMIAAEFTSAVSVPRHATARSTRACAASIWVRSACSATAWPPASVMSRAVSSAPSRDPLKCTTTCIPRVPSANAMARPTRRPAPVTSATRPARASPASGGGCTAERLDPLVLAAQPVDRHVHHADRAWPVRGPMPVGAPAGDETELVDAGAQARDFVRRVRRMLHLDAIEPEPDECFDALAGASRAGVREDRQTARGVYHGDRFAHSQLLFGDVGRPPGAEVAVERVAHIGRPPVGHQRAGDVRAADGTGAGLQED